MEANERLVLMHHQGYKSLQPPNIYGIAWKLDGAYYQRFNLEINTTAHWTLNRLILQQDTKQQP